jgi:hypothetical protein
MVRSHAPCVTSRTMRPHATGRALICDCPAHKGGRERKGSASRSAKDSNFKQPSLRDACANEIPSRSRGADCARVVHELFAPKQRGRRECRALDAPAASRAKGNEHTSIVTTVTPVSPGIPRANGFNGLLRALPGDRAFLSPSSAKVISANLIPASRNQDHTASPSAVNAFVPCVTRVHRIPRPTCRDDRDTPLFIGHGMMPLYCCFYLFEKRILFCCGAGQPKSR